MSLDLHRALADSRRNPVVVDRGYDCALIHARETDEWGVGHSLDRSWSYEHDGATWGLTEDEARAEYLDERNLRYCPEHRVYFADNEYTRCGQCPDPLAPPVVEVATAERKPCGAWVDHLHYACAHLLLATGPRGMLRASVGYTSGPDAHSWRLTASDNGTEPTYLAVGRGLDSMAAAQLAAEDAARSLLLDALAVLAPGMPEGWRIERFKSSIVLRDPEDVGVFVGSEAKADALALGMLAAVRK